MSNNIEKAESLRQLADLIESGKIPDGESPEQPLRTHFGYGSVEEVERASEVFVAAGATLRGAGVDDEITVAEFGTGGFNPGLEVSLYNWGDSNV